jgi:general stress protein 26
MMANDIEQKIHNYLSSHRYLNLATVGPDGTPVAHTVGYASDGATVYFMTDKNSRKAKNISGSKAVAYTIDEDYTDIHTIQGVQMKGNAELVKDNAVIEKIIGILTEKFLQLRDLPPSPDYVIFRIDPIEAYFLDNTVRFGHRDRVNF